MKTLLKLAPFIAIIALAGVVMFDHQSLLKEREEAQALRQQVDQLGPLEAENERLSNLVVQAGSTTPDRVHDLAKLRAEVVQLRGQSAQLEAAKAREEKAASEVAALRAQTGDMAKLQEENRQLQARTQAADSAQAQNACINNLRLIDSAKQQWALENHKTVADTATPNDLRPYLGRGTNGELPVCPSGGVYTYGTIGEPPKCSIPGHVLQ